MGVFLREPLLYSLSLPSPPPLQGSSPVEECPNLMLKLSMCWLRGPPQHKLCSELDTALDLKKIREGNKVLVDRGPGRLVHL